MTTVSAAWVLSLMLSVQPKAPWRETYERSAEAIARAASARPLFRGDLAAERTAAVLVSFAWFEGTLRPDAVGDMRNGRPTSYCMFQVNESNFASLGVTGQRLVEDVDACVDAGLRMLHVSFGVCRREPLEHRADHYAVGGDGCRRPARDEGVHRMKKALALFAKLPPPPPEPSDS